MKLDELLPDDGFEFKWENSNSLEGKVLGEVSTQGIFLKLQCNRRCVVGIVSRSMRDGVVISFEPQPLDCVSSHERWHSISCLFANAQYRRLF